MLGTCHQILKEIYLTYLHLQSFFSFPASKHIQATINFKILEPNPEFGFPCNSLNNHKALLAQPKWQKSKQLNNSYITSINKLHMFFPLDRSI